MMIIRKMLAISIIILFNIFNYGQSTQQDQQSIEVKVITIPELNEIVNKRMGRPLIINLWATWCIPCREEFPDLIKIAENYSENVEVIGISLDYPDEIDSKILPFLSEHPPNFANYVNGEKDSENFINNLNEEWSGAIPATFFYDSSGKQVLFHQEKLSFKEMEGLVVNLINN